MVVLEDFEGDLSAWNNIVGSWSISSDSILGSQSAQADVDGFNNPNPGEVGQLSVDSIQPTEFSFWYKETSDSIKAGLVLLDANDNVVVGAGSDNPQYNYTLDGESDFREGTNIGVYDEWVQVTFNFNWTAQEVQISWVPDNSSLSSGSSGPLSLENRNPVETVGVGGITTGNSVFMWYDQIEAVIPDQGFDIFIDGEQVQEITIDGEQVQDVTIDGDTV